MKWPSYGTPARRIGLRNRVRYSLPCAYLSDYDT